MKTIFCSNYKIHINHWMAFEEALQEMKPSSIFILVDENSEKFCLPYVLEKIEVKSTIIRINSGEQNKSLNTCQLVWTKLLQNGADRHSLLINLGGGVIGDLGGFCAATYMRGIKFIQMPTTLLSQVDASIGGKTGVDLQGSKNIVGLIKDPAYVFVFTDYLKSLSFEQIRSGYAELLKHGLISDKNIWHKLSDNFNLTGLNFEDVVFESITIKKSITEQDPNELGIRKILNFGHTIGHALESYWMESRTPLLHGEAVAIGLVCEAFLSYRIGNINEPELFEIRNSILKIFGHHPKFVKPDQELITLMLNDKKNYGGNIRFSLLKSIGNACFDIQISKNDIQESIIFYKEKI